MWPRWTACGKVLPRSVARGHVRQALRERQRGYGSCNPSVPFADSAFLAHGISRV
jgi:hypothetical protein